MESQCLCQGIRIEISLSNNAGNNNNKDSIITCHFCQHCRKYHLSAFSRYIKTTESQVSIILQEEEEEEVLGRYRDSCHQLGDVLRWVCTKCSSKLFTTIYPNSTDTWLVNMGPLVDATIPRYLGDRWRKQKTTTLDYDNPVWQESQKCGWVDAIPTINAIIPRTISSFFHKEKSTLLLTGGCMLLWCLSLSMSNQEKNNRIPTLLLSNV